MINVTKTFLPPFEEYTNLLKRAWDKAWITNNGELVQELETRLKHYLNMPHLLYCNNGTVVLQMALKALAISKEVITTPFSYVATTNTIIWENCQPVFVDIDPKTFCINPDLIESAITENTEAILATHVFGIPCDVEKIETIAKKHNLKVIYDGAHAFGSVLNEKAVLQYGDISTCSFHATKLFHTVEGGSISANNDEALQRVLYLFRQFGHEYDDYFSVGVNAKSSEFHAAMGLAIFPYIDQLIAARKRIVEQYCSCLSGSRLRLMDVSSFKFQWNYAYFPVLFENETSLLQAKAELNKNAINARRYFYPSLNTLPFVQGSVCQVSEDISKRILCLPLYPELGKEEVCKISKIVSSVL